MADKCLLFAYGLLRHDHTSAPRTLSSWWPDRIKGRLFGLAEFPAATEVGTAPTWIEGEVQEIDRDELPLLDDFEDTEGGLYRRILVTTEQGYSAWVYEYLGEIPADRPQITAWRP